MRQGERVGYRPALDGLRGIAILLVMLTHAGVPNLDAAGSVGVTLFFVLSGFLITQQLSCEHEGTGRINLRRFYARRARRLLPALSLLLMAVAAYLLSSHQSLLPVLLAAGYVTNIANALGQTQGNLDHTWSLSLEEQFYLLWPLLLPLVARRGRPVLFLVLAATVSAALRSGLWLAGAPIYRIYSGPDTRADAILVGCALAFLATRVDTRWVNRAAIPSAILMVVACTTPWAVFVWLLTPLPLASATLILCAERNAPKILTWRPLVLTGKISYGLYLWNLPVALSLRSWHAPLWATGLALLVVNFALATLSWFIMERPFRHRPVTDAGHGVAIVSSLQPPHREGVTLAP
jgi:peptidoglycan/LPS O-acetylase OafA/YrhL